MLSETLINEIAAILKDAIRTVYSRKLQSHQVVKGLALDSIVLPIWHSLSQYHWQKSMCKNGGSGIQILESTIKLVWANASF